MIYYKSTAATTLKENNIAKKRNVVSAKKKETIKDSLSKDSSLSVCIMRKLGGIGDILMATPLLREIKVVYPESALTFAIDITNTNDYYDLVKNNPYIDHLIDFRKCNPDSYDLFKDITSVCLQYENSGAAPLNRIDIFAKSCGIRLSNGLPDYIVEDDELEWASNFIQKSNPNNLKVIMMHTASFDKKRTWPIEKYVETISLLNKNNEFLYLVNDYQQYYKYWSSIKNVIDISNFSLRAKSALMKFTDLFIGPDSGPLHIAGSLKVNGIGIFSSIPPEARLNHYKTFTGIKHGALSCQPCWYDTCPFNYKCMTNLSAERVANLALEKLL